MYALWYAALKSVIFDWWWSNSKMSVWHNAVWVFTLQINLTRRLWTPSPLEMILHKSGLLVGPGPRRNPEAILLSNQVSLNIFKVQSILSGVLFNIFKVQSIFSGFCSIYSRFIQYFRGFAQHSQGSFNTFVVYIHTDTYNHYRDNSPKTHDLPVSCWWRCYSSRSSKHLQNEFGSELEWCKLCPAEGSVLCERDWHSLKETPEGRQTCRFYRRGVKRRDQIARFQMMQKCTCIAPSGRALGAEPYFIIQSHIFVRERMIPGQQKSCRGTVRGSLDV